MSEQAMHESGLVLTEGKKVSASVSQDNESTKAIKQPIKSSLSAFGTLLGVLVIVLATFSWLTNMQLSDIMVWIDRHFGISFLFLYASLCFAACVSILNVLKNTRPEFYFQVGIQAANGISTLALTFTLLGISLGIGSLSDQTLTPENVNTVISELTAQFSMAFMTTVLGLPTAALVRASLSIIVSNIASKSSASVKEQA